MASPQTEDGFTRVAHEILEQTAKVNLNGTQLRILLIVWRYTYGFSRKEHRFSLSFLAEALDANKKQIQRELKILVDRNILTVISGGERTSRTLSFNKDYETWDSKSDYGLAVRSEEPKKEDWQLISGQIDANLTTNPLPKIERSSLKKKELNYLKDMSETEGQEPVEKKEKIQFIDTVFLTQVEYDRLCEEFGKEAVDLCIETLDEWQTNNPKKAKKDHNKTIRVWIKKDAAKRKQYPAFQTKQQRNAEQMDVLKNLFEEGSNEQAGNSAAFGSYQDGVPKLRNN